MYTQGQQMSLGGDIESRVHGLPLKGNTGNLE